MEGAEVKENPDISYIKRDDIGVVIAKGLARLYRAQPKDPVDYLARWLLNFSNIKSQSNTMIEKKQKQQELKDRKDLDDQNKMRDVEEQLKKEKEHSTKIDDFRDKVATSDDLSDMLQEFTHYLKEFTGATGVYIGRLIKPNKQIQEGDDDKAHENPEANEIIRYIYATQDHEFMINKTLSQEQGLTHDVFKPEVQKEDEGITSDIEDHKPKEPLNISPKHLFISEVVRENRVHYFKVPKLGSYLAVELKYNSCLTEEAFEKAYEDFLEWETKREAQNKKKQEEDQENEDREDEEEENKEQEEVKQVEEIKEKPFDTEQKRFVVCLDTMGQDIQFTENQISFVLDNVQHFSDSWTKTEDNNLKIDIRKRYETNKRDREYTEGELGHALQEEEDKFIDEYFDSLEEPLEEEAKAERIGVIRLKFILHKVCDGDWKQEILRFRDYKVVRFPRFWQSLFYFLGYSREEICEEGTNKLFWKIASRKLNDGLFEKCK